MRIYLSIVFFYIEADFTLQAAHESKLKQF